MLLQSWEGLSQAGRGHDVLWPFLKNRGWKCRASNFSFYITPYSMPKWVTFIFILLFSMAHIKFIVCKTKLCVGLLLQDFKKSTTCGVSSEQRNLHCKNDLVCGGELTSIEKALNPLETTESLQDRGLVVVLVQLIQCLYPFFI